MAVRNSEESSLLLVFGMYQIIQACHPLWYSEWEHNSEAEKHFQTRAYAKGEIKAKPIVDGRRNSSS